MSRFALALCLLLVAPAVARAGDSEAEVTAVADAYLKALTGEGDDKGKDLLLGGATMNAQLFNLENWTVLSKDPVRKEEGDLGHAAALMADLDKAGREALTKMMGSKGVDDDLSTTELSLEEAMKIMGPTRVKRDKLVKSHPVLAYVARVTKEVYWHPKNPVRAVIAKAGGKGRYTLEVHRWKMESREGPRKSPRQWPLRMVRFKCAAFDTGWKVLPASDWNAE